MHSYTIFLYICTLLLFITNSQLTYVAQLFRHGARYTLHKFYDYKQTYANKGQLTSTGMRQQYNLGTYIRRDYIQKNSFLSPNYNSNQLNIFAAPGNRIYVSAYSHLYGLYPNGTGPTIPEGLDPSYLQPPFQTNNQNIEQQQQGGLPNRFQPIPVHDGKKYLDDCPNSVQFEARRLIQQSQWYGRLNVQYLPFMERMKKIFQIDAAYQINLLSMSLLYDVIVADKYLNRPLPTEFTDQDFANLRHMTHFMLALVWSGQFSQILSTPIFQRIISDFDLKLGNPNSQRKFTILSGHDTNVAPAAWFLNISSAKCIEDIWKNNSKAKHLNCEPGPDFAANLIVELYNGITPYVKVRYNGKYMNLCDRVSTECSYSEWKSRIESQYVDYVKLCGIKSNEAQYKSIFVEQMNRLKSNLRWQW